MPDFTAMAMDGVEKVARYFDDLEARPAGAADPDYPISETVKVSRQGRLYVYHLADSHLGQGASFGNARCWAQTKGTGSLQTLYSIEQAKVFLGGLNVSYLMPFRDLSVIGRPPDDAGPPTPEVEHDRHVREQLIRAAPLHRGQIHLHAAYQQREFDIGDGLHVLETFFVPRTGMEDPPLAYHVVNLHNRTNRPVGITLVASLDMRGHTPRNIVAEYHDGHHCLLTWNEDDQQCVRFFGASDKPDHYLATSAEEDAYNPHRSLTDQVTNRGDLLGALQFDVKLLPNQQHKLRIVCGWSTDGADAAKQMAYRAARDHSALQKTVEYYSETLDRSELMMPDDVLNQGVQWSKANMLRPLARYAVGDSTTNDPGESSNLVGRDLAWYAQGMDLLLPEAACSSLRILATHQREDGLIPEYINGMTGDTESHDFNINDNTPLFVVAVAHHLSVAAHEDCQDTLYEPAKKALELILSQRDERGLVVCTAAGMGAKGICGWRNVLQNEQINGAVTEVNAQCYGALTQLARVARARGDSDAQRYELEARRLREAINEHLVDKRSNLYVRNIDLDGRVYSQATVDMVFALVFDVAERQHVDAVSTRLFAPDIMTSGGLRTISEQNPRWNASEESGLVGGVWPGATWWFAMGCSTGYAGLTADSLRRSYAYLLRDPRTYNTVPGQFNEWSDGQTLVNRGMRLSPWTPPRFLWAALEGLAGVKITPGKLELNPRLPRDWRWIYLSKLPVGDRLVEALVTRQEGDWHVYTNEQSLVTPLTQHLYPTVQPDVVETLTTGMITTTMRRDGEILLFFGSARDQLLVGPVLAHHALDSSMTYTIHRYSSIEDRWESIGQHQGKHLHRLAVRIEPGGFNLYRFVIEN